MDDKVTINLDHDSFDALSKRAEEHGRSVGEEAGEIVRTRLRERTRASTDRSELIRRSRELRAMAPVQQTDSTLLIREDRDRGHSIDRR